MQTTILGKTDIHLSTIIMGTWQTGKAMWAGISDAQSEKAIRAAMDAGITTFDTAEVYGNGHSEKVLGKAIGSNRDKVHLLSKVFSNHLKRDQVIQACNRSLKNLGTDYLDLYQIHWPPGSFGAKPVPMEETMDALNELKLEGKIRAIGVSNFSLDQLKAISRIGAVESLQPPYSLFWRHVENDTLAWCQANQVTVMAYSPMAQGLLTGKFGPEHRFEKGDHRSNNRLFQPDVYPKVQTALAALRPIAEKKGITLGQLALAWVIAKPGVCAIAGARNAEQSTSNAKAATVTLSESELAELDRISRPVTACIDDNPVPWKW
ncbi:aldo/keto reductase [Desulfosarcina ovata]|uniref:Oxidoreductase n=1 Tax=Desulfosarcina ovata subsp. ovata TaxID=2752305 RepID=A0A5K8AJX1_9BACT|nr:aldo/keto reductase [Desulfosarcina ovata]BBO93013.1 oxidoreductase [Desulfosarcina ovata subsp. ovata]